jgi:hypothetical protein
MSSAILYLAIVAIWACVLIPRWLRRDSARTVTAPVPAEPQAETLAADVQDEEPTPEPAPVHQPLTAEESRRRMLAARVRLLLMLFGLEIAAIALAMLGLAAVWVVIPPSIMLGGYLLLLREAAKADAEIAVREAEAVARERERHRARMRALQARRDGVREDTTTGGAELAAKFAAAPVAGDYDDAGPGRDFAPGLAGKYTTSNAGVDGDDEQYGGYDAPRLRAVGD